VRQDKPRIHRPGSVRAPLPEEVPTLWERLKDWVHGEFLWFDRFLKRWFVRSIMIGSHTMVLVIACYFIMWWFAVNQVYSDVDSVPFHAVGLVLGTSKKYHGADNAFFTERINAAARLYAAGKVKYLLVSGDNHRAGYDEPTDMKAALVSKGVPADRIYCDYAGLHTLDSILRAKMVFGQSDFTVISQRFQNERALYIARRNGLDEAIAFNARDAPFSHTLKMYLREIPARVAAVIQVEFLRSKPHIGGPKVVIGPDNPPVDAPTSPASLSAPAAAGN
jgi:SanA protein